MGLVQAKIDKLRGRISAFANEQSVFNLGNAFSTMTIEIATGFIMGQSHNNLDPADTNSSTMKMLQSAGILWRVTKHVLFLEPMIRLMPPGLVSKIGDQSTTSYLAFMKLCRI